MKLLLAILFLTVMGAESPVTTLHVTPAQQYYPGTVLFQVSITPHRDNFWLCNGWQNETTGKYRKSCQQLNGIYSPRLFQFEWRLLEVGKYVGFVEVYRTPNYLAGDATEPFTVLK